MTTEAIAHFRARLAFETDVSDVHAALTASDDFAAGKVDNDKLAGAQVRVNPDAIDFVLIDSRSTVSWDQGHIPGALHLPTAEIATRARDLVPAGTRVVTYCWGPGCNGATRAALAFAELGYPVREMLGGFEYWAREGFAVETASGRTRGEVDPLTAPAHAVACGC
ncbi:Rhodanese-related sulfurtransferase [Alloactinosynnema sp. L-07]|uniref:rhodanese-like domain-containing protein n=1 Tax=Alloactinosynnema sp. L-07 TaxID=1653480 RepID=UPI00065F032C|nr:rhodanese-like domain-containing protein [Alloactinosynnema sp. L-07]CRK62083.1 Rhodanese-related sulfurtransferase [Alloactinosynnema sp. L-07]